MSLYDHALSAARRTAPATQRNREPIAEVLAQFLPPDARVLEIASGTGEHAVYLSRELKVAHWWPSDRDADALTSIEGWRRWQHEQRSEGQTARSSTTLHPASLIDVSRDDPARFAAANDLPPLDALVCINMIHIAPWEACEGLMRWAAALLKMGGLLYLYGPYRRDGQHTAPSNAEFDASLQDRNRTWGVRDMEAVVAEAGQHGLTLEASVAMPANNFSLLLRKSADRVTPA